MEPLKMKDIAEATGGRIVSGSPETTVLRVSQDSRDADEGTLFFALIGEKNDAHRFIPEAAAAGCGAFVISEKDALDRPGIGKDTAAVLVEDTNQALRDLAE